MSVASPLISTFWVKLERFKVFFQELIGHMNCEVKWRIACTRKNKGGIERTLGMKMAIREYGAYCDRTI